MNEVQLLRGSVMALQRQRDEWVAKHKECTRCLGEALQEATDMAADRDSWKQAHDEQVTKLLEISASRDEYQREADNMAAAHKVERDALAAQLETLRYELDAVPAIKAERDALKDAARLALDALSDERYVPSYSQVREAIKALEAVL